MRLSTINSKQREESLLIELDKFTDLVGKYKMCGSEVLTIKDKINGYGYNSLTELLYYSKKPLIDFNYIKEYKDIKNVNDIILEFENYINKNSTIYNINLSDFIRTYDIDELHTPKKSYSNLLKEVYIKLSNLIIGQSPNTRNIESDINSMMDELYRRLPSTYVYEYALDEKVNKLVLVMMSTTCYIKTVVNPTLRTY